MASIVPTNVERTVVPTALHHVLLGPYTSRTDRTERLQPRNDRQVPSRNRLVPPRPRRTPAASPPADGPAAVPATAAASARPRAGGVRGHRVSRTRAGARDGTRGRAARDLLCRVGRCAGTAARGGERCRTGAARAARREGHRGTRQRLDRDAGGDGGEPGFARAADAAILRRARDRRAARRLHALELRVSGLEPDIPEGRRQPLPQHGLRRIPPTSRRSRPCWTSRRPSPRRTS